MVQVTVTSGTPNTVEGTSEKAYGRGSQSPDCLICIENGELYLLGYETNITLAIAAGTS